MMMQEEVKEVLDENRNRNGNRNGVVVVGSSWERALLGYGMVTCNSTCKDALSVGEELDTRFTQGGGFKGVIGRVGKFERVRTVDRGVIRAFREVGRLSAQWTRCLHELVEVKKAVKIKLSVVDAPAGRMSICTTFVCSITVEATPKLFQSLSDLDSHMSPMERHLRSGQVSNPAVELIRGLLGIRPKKKAVVDPKVIVERSNALLDLEKWMEEEAKAKGKGGDDQHHHHHHHLQPLNPQTPKQVKSEPIFGVSRRVSLSQGQDRQALVSSSQADNVLHELEDAGETTYGQKEMKKLCSPITEGRDLPQEVQPGNLRAQLRPYQLQALHWMKEREKLSGGSKRVHKTEEVQLQLQLHPCYEEYLVRNAILEDGKKRQRDGKDLRFWLNVFSGALTLEFPSADRNQANGGILADAMGLGKTVMTIAHILNNPVTQEERKQEAPVPVLANQNNQSLVPRQAPPPLGGTLILCPMTLLSQWSEECALHAPGLKTFTYYGQGRLSGSGPLRELESADVVLTTYGVLSSECRNQETSPLYRLKWFRIVLDEAHYIKNQKTRTARAARSLSSQRRWCLTGTPIQNSLMDLHSLFQFLRIEPWDNFAWFRKLILQPYEEGNKGAMILLQNVLRPILLRRTKDTLDKNNLPILVLPGLCSKVIKLEMLPQERQFYQALHRRAKREFNTYLKEGAVMHNYSNILELLLRLRQACNHPYLVLDGVDPSKWEVEKLVKILDGEDSDSGAGDIKLLTQKRVESHNSNNRLAEAEAFELNDSTRVGASPYMESLRQKWKHSTKCSAVLGTIVRLSNERKSSLPGSNSSGGKVVVFSQWTSFLDILEIALANHEVSFTRLDGKLSQQQRQNVLQSFMSKDPRSPFVLLCSLKAGGVGLNLTNATHVILCDPWWNPAIEEQAIMRIHRIGQTQKVSVTRFIVENSVEEQMTLVQERKRTLCSGALTGSEARLTRLEDLKLLFQS